MKVCWDLGDVERPLSPSRRVAECDSRWAYEGREGYNDCHATVISSSELESCCWGGGVLMVAWRRGRLERVGDCIRRLSWNSESTL